MGLGNFIKKLIETNTIWGVRSKKLAGINDYANHITTNVNINSSDNSIDFAPLLVPDFIKIGQYIRVFAGTNDTRLFRVKRVFEGTKIEVHESVNDDIGVRRITARLWEIHDDPSISRPSSTGSTMFNVHNRSDTGLEDASAVAFTYAEHYHDEAITEDDKGEPISTQYNQLGYKSLIKADCCGDVYLEMGPVLIFDDEGNIVLEKKDDNMGVC